MSEPIVIELQRLASEKSQDVDDLLRKALIVATKLNIEDFRQWVNRELHGYEDRADVPKYRHVRAVIQAYNPAQGRLIPYYLPEDVADLLCNVHVTQPLGTLAELERSESSYFTITLMPAEEQALLEMQGEFPMQPVRTVPRMAAIRIIDAIRTTILQWALQLEKEGITGAGMSFSQDEMQKAASSTTVHIANFQGILGNVSESEVSQHLQMTVSLGDFDSLRCLLQSKGVNDADLEELKEAIRSDAQPEEPGKFGDKVSVWIGKMTTKAASGAWKIGVAVAGNLLANSIAKYYGM